LTIFTFGKGFGIAADADSKESLEVQGYKFD
jgi:hypothetical protein